MCKFICSFFSSTSNVISTTGKAVEIGLKVVNSGISEINTEIKEFSNHLEKKTKLMKVARLVYENQLSIYQALSNVNQNFGTESVVDFEYELDKFRELEYKLYSYKIFPLDNNEVPFSRDIVSYILSFKYGKIDNKQFECYLKERRDWIIDFVSKDYSERRALSLLNDKELHNKYLHKKIELDRFISSFK